MAARGFVVQCWAVWLARCWQLAVCRFCSRAQLLRRSPGTDRDNVVRLLSVSQPCEPTTNTLVRTATHAKFEGGNPIAVAFERPQCDDDHTRTGRRRFGSQIPRLVRVVTRRCGNCRRDRTDPDREPADRGAV